MFGFYNKYKGKKNQCPEKFLIIHKHARFKDTRCVYDAIRFICINDSVKFSTTSRILILHGHLLLVILYVCIRKYFMSREDDNEMIP